MKSQRPLINYYPKHVAFIMDGNRRWAKKKNLPVIEGHKRGSVSIKNIVKKSLEYKIRYLTFFSFSTENWKRSPKEIEELQELLYYYLESEQKTFIREKIKFNTIGDLSRFKNKIREKIENLKNITSGFSKICFTLALNYGSRNEIINAVKKILLMKKKNIDENNFPNYLMTSGLPDPDLIIRTSGEMRISNFLLWQLSYSELFFTKTLWPDFTSTKYNNALDNFIKRKRRFGSK